MRFVLAAAAVIAALVAVAVPARAHTAAPGPQCGGTLWKLMTLSDTGKTGVSWAPAATNIGDIAKLTAPAKVPSITSIEDYQLHLAAASANDLKAKRDIINSSVKPGTGKPSLLDFVQKTASDTYESSRRLEDIGKNYQPKSPYPQTQLAGRLKLAAQLIDYC